MPSAPPFAQSSSSHALFPALYLYPLNDSFIPKHISLAQGQRVKIGRQTNAKTAPGERNGFFDSKVLSRQHAEVWEEGGRIFIKDVKSSNGTFINGERLSPEAEESKPWELKSDDIVEFGIDIVGEDNKTIIHHKVAARVVCVFNEQDAQVAARAEQHAHYSSQSPSPSSSSNVQGGFSFGPGPQQQQQQQQQRRQPIQAALTGMGGMGGSMRPPGKSGLTFDHILSRLQGELQKSRETGAELNTLTNTMGEIHETLGGSLPNTLPPYPTTLPPVRPPQAPSPPQQQSSNTSPQPAPSVPSTALLADLQSQLASTQSNLAEHVEKIRALEGMLAEQETIKREMRILREMIEFRKESEDRKGKGRYEEEEHELEEESDDDDDARSVSTVIPHELERVDEVDEEQEEEHPSDRSAQSTSEHEQDQETEEQEHARRRGEAESAGRPHTPEPTNLGMSIRSNSNTSSGGRSGSPLSQVITAEEDRLSTLHDTVASLTNQVSSIVSFTSTLEAQHTVAQETIRTLEGKVESLELVLREVRAEQTRVAEAEESRLQLEEDRKIRLEDQVRSDAQEKESLTALVTTWKKSVEGQWSSIREEWAQERERLSKAREEWETKAKSVDVGMEKMSRFMDEQTQRARELHAMGNGETRLHSSNGHGLVTPPSPRSQSSDSGRYRRRRKSTSSRSRSRGRSRSHSPHIESGEGEEEHTLDTDTDTTLASEDNAKSGGAIHGGKEKQKGLSIIPERSLVTPEPSLYTDTVASGEDDTQSFSAEKVSLSRIDHANGISFQTAFGVLVLSAAAAAVLWRVKPE